MKYTQGMNYIVAYLMNYMTEERAYLCCCQLLWMPPYNLMNMFSDGFADLYIALFQVSCCCCVPRSVDEIPVKTALAKTLQIPR